MNALLEGRAWWRVKTMGVLLLIAAMVLPPYARPAHAQIPSGDVPIIFCNNPNTVWNNPCSALSRLEKQAAADVLRIHQLPDSQAVRVLVWQRNQIRALMFDKILAIILKAPASRTADEAAIYELMASYVQDKRLQAAQFSKSEYNRWYQEGCSYVPPAPFTYTPNAAVCVSPIGGYFGNLKPPSLQDFTNYGVAHVYDKYVSDPQYAEAIDGTATAYGLLGGLAAAGIGGVFGAVAGATAVSGGAIMGAIFPYAGVYVTAGGSTAVSSSAVATVGTASFASAVAIVIAAIAILVTQGINVFEAAAIPGKLDAAIAAAAVSPDLRASVTNSDATKKDDGLREVFAAFIDIVVGHDYDTSYAPVPAPTSSDRKFRLSGPLVGTTTAASFQYLDWNNKTRSVRMNDHWFIVNEDGVERYSLSIDVLDELGKPWTVWRVGDQFLKVRAVDASGASEYVTGFTALRPVNVNGNQLYYIVNLTPANAAPSFTWAGSDMVVNEDSSFTQPVSNVTPNLNIGEDDQTVRFEVKATRTPANGVSIDGVMQPVSADDFFTSQPTLDANGRLRFTLTPNAFGVLDVEVRARDSGPSGGENITVSPPVHFKLTINPVNDPPFVPATPATLVTKEDTPVSVWFRSLGVNDDADQKALGNDELYLGDSYSSQRLVTAPRNGSVVFQRVTEGTAPPGGVLIDYRPGLIYTPKPNFFGSDSFVYEICDTGVPGIACSQQTVNVTVNNVFDPPTFTPGGNVTVAENSGPYDQVWATNVAAGPGEADTFVFRVQSNSNPALFVQPLLSLPGQGVMLVRSNGTARLTFTTAPNASGTAVITVVPATGYYAVQGDPTGGILGTPVTFTITVTPVEDTPTSTSTPVPTSTDTAVPTSTDTAVPTSTHTAAPASTDTAVPTSTYTATPSSTARTASVTRTSSVTRTPSVTRTATRTVSATRTATPTRTATRTATGATEPSTVIASADGSVRQKDPKQNQGSKKELLVDGSNDPREVYLRFIVSGLTGARQKVILRLYVTNGTKDGPRLYQAANTTWTESGLTWDTRPGATGPALGNLVKVNAKTWVEYDVTNVVTGNGTYSFVLVGDSSDGVAFTSREGSNKPQLVVSTQR